MYRGFEKAPHYLRERFAGTLLAAICISGFAQASATYLTSQTAIGQNDSILWVAIGGDRTVYNPTSAFSTSGMRFRVSKPTAGNFRVASEGFAGTAPEPCVQSQNSRSVLLEFEGGLSAAGARVYLSQPKTSSVTLRAYNSYGALILQSTESRAVDPNGLAKFMGVQATGESIRSIEFIASEGSIALGTVAMKSGAVDPAERAQTMARPIAIDDSYTLHRNTSLAQGQANVMVNDVRAQGVKLLTPPSHAESFRLGSDGSMEYRPLRNFHGLDTFTYVAVTNAGVESAPATVMVNVLNVATQPTFYPGEDQIVPEESGPQVIKDWASQIDSGTVDDESSVLRFVTMTDRKDLFEELPSINAKGDLKFTPAPHASGVAKVLVWLRNEGPRVSSEVAASTACTLTITITPVPHRPILEPIPDQTVFENEKLNLRVKATMIDFGKAVIYRLVEAPEGVSLNSVTGDLSWTPSEGMAPGTYLIAWEAQDTSTDHLKSVQSFRVRVVRRFMPVKLRPIAPLETIPGKQITFKLQTDATADESTNLSYMLGSSATGAELNAETGEFTWTPRPQDAGISHTFFISVYDRRISRLSSVESFTVTVKNGVTLDIEIKRPMKVKKHSTKRSKAKSSRRKGGRAKR